MRGGLNTYGYAAGNPVLNVDPFGLETLCDALRYLAEKEKLLGGPDAFADQVLRFSDYPQVFHEYYPPNHDADGNELFYGTGGENFMHSNGAMFDIQYVQIGFASARKSGGMNTILVFEGASALGMRSSPWPEDNEGYKSNQRGTAMGMMAQELGSMSALYADQCEQEKCGE